MSGIVLRAEGILLTRGERSALLLQQGAGQIILRLGFVARGSEEIILPESVLDDWGHEIAGIELYGWVRENGSHFPRAEMFGLDLSDRPQQYFIRELDLAARYPCFAYEELSASVSTGVHLKAILIPEAGLVQPRRIDGYPRLADPLRVAAVDWWSIDPAAQRQAEMVLLDG